jgi:hypothetical protein
MLVVDGGGAYATQGQRRERKNIHWTMPADKLAPVSATPILAAAMDALAPQLALFTFMNGIAIG